MPPLSRPMTFVMMLMRAVVAVLICGFSVWGALALTFKAPFGPGVRIVLAGVVAAAAVLALVGLFRHQARLAAPALLMFPALLVWWASLAPSQTRPWAG